MNNKIKAKCINCKVHSIEDVLSRRIRYIKSIFGDKKDRYNTIVISEYVRCIKRAKSRGNKYELNKQLNNADLLILPRIVISVSNRCSLNCRDCNDLMPYAKKKYDMPIEKQIEDIKKLLAHVDRIINVEIIGGEPFLYKELEKLLEFLKRERKIDFIEITTNGTIIPKENMINILKSPKVYVQISNYGHLNRKKSKELFWILRKSNINIKRLGYRKWYNAGNIKKRNKSKIRLRYEYYSCNCKDVCRTMYRGKLFVCGRAPILYELDLLKNNSSYLNLEENGKSVFDKEKLRMFFLNSYAECCDYCDYASDNLKYVSPGIQL